MSLLCFISIILVTVIVVVILLAYLVSFCRLNSSLDMTIEPGPSHCDHCGMMKNVLKNEILNELLPFIRDTVTSVQAQTVETVHHTPNLSLINPIAQPMLIDGVISSDISDINERITKLENQASANLARYIQARDAFQVQITDLKRDCDGKYADVTRNLRELRRDVDRNDEDICRLFVKAEDQQQYSRRHILEISGCQESKSEDTTEIALRVFRALGVSIGREHISRSHRQRKGRNNRRPRPIYVQFISHDVRDAIYNARHFLRNIPEFRHVFINENLTRFRSWLYSHVRKECKRNLYHWTYDGTIYVSKDGTYKNARQIMYKSDFFEVFGKEL